MASNQGSPKGRSCGKGRPAVYMAQISAIHVARAQLEAVGVLQKHDSLDDLRRMAGELNGGVESLSKLSLEQRHELIAKLIEMGATVRNPILYNSDLRAEAKRDAAPRKVVSLFGAVGEKHLRLVDSLAREIRWPAPDSYEKLCIKLFDAPRPSNRREIRQLLAVLGNIAKKEAKGDAGQNG